MAIHLKNPIIVALDVDTREECLRLARLLEGKVGAVKVGPRLCVRYGADLISELARALPVFVDNKYLDIPNTMESAVRATFEAGASLATVHAWSGVEALRRLAALEQELNAKRPFQILVVTILTSFNSETLPPPLSQFSIAEQVSGLSDLAVGSGLTGLVCSPEEVADLRARHPHAFLVTPGIRLPDYGKTDDQKRVLGPSQALERGASALVVGRPIIEAADPVAAADRILSDIGAYSRSR